MSLDRYIRGFGPSFVLVDDLFAILHNQPVAECCAARIIFRLPAVHHKLVG